MAKKTKTQEPVAPVDDKAPYWKLFFRDQRSPLVRSQLITALMSGHVLEVERLPVGALPDVVLFAMAARNYLDAEIVDDYNELLQRTDDKWKDPLWSCKTFDQYHSQAVSAAIMWGTTHFKCAEEQYIPDLVEWLLQHDPPEYFSEELETMKDVVKWKKVA